MSDPISVAIAYHSGYGHTARQAAAVAAGADSVPNARAVLLDVTTLDGALWATLDAAEAIIFGSPTYMGGTSATFQAFAEASSAIWADGGWRDKLAAGFTNSAWWPPSWAPLTPSPTRPATTSAAPPTTHDPITSGGTR